MHEILIEYRYQIENNIHVNKMEKLINDFAW